MAKHIKKSVTAKKTKAQRRVVATMFASSGLRALSVVILTVAAGGLILPSIFAATVNPQVTGLSISPSNNSTYNITLNWSANKDSDYGWNIDVSGPGDSRNFNVNGNNRSHVINKVTCGVGYNFRVATNKPGGGVYGGASQTGSSSTVCPQAVINVAHSNGNLITFGWTPTTFGEAYSLFLSTNGGGYGLAYNGSGGSWQANGACNTAYSAYVIAGANGQNGPASGVQSLRTAACPVAPAPAPATSPAPAPSSPAPSSGGSSGGGSSSSGGSSGGTTKPPTGGGTTKAPVKSSTPKAAGGAASTAALVDTTPQQPQNFSATVTSNKIVELSWDAANNADHYIISRSTDGASWQQLAETKETDYNDESAEFSKTYYYQLQAINSAGAGSGMATAQATTEAFAASSKTIVSDDKKVTITVPDGAFDGEYSCTLGSDDSTSKVPAGQVSVLGPYDLLCVTADGDVVSNFDKPLKVSITLGKSADGYKNISIQLAGDNGWNKVNKITYDQKKQTIGFELSSAKSFGVFGSKQKSSAWIFIVLFLILLLIGAGIFFWLRRRRAQDDPYASYSGAPAVVSSMSDEGAVTAGAAAVVAPNTAEEEFRQAVAQPDCTHLEMAQQVIPSSQGCLECEQQGTHWNSLRICLICGHVGCSDDSPEQHALKHFQATGHPLIYEYGNPAGNNIGWCYIDQTYI